MKFLMKYIKRCMFLSIFLVGDDVKEYVIETPEREPLPDDYGDTEIWIETN